MTDRTYDNDAWLARKKRIAELEQENKRLREMLDICFAEFNADYENALERWRQDPNRINEITVKHLDKRCKQIVKALEEV